MKIGILDIVPDVYWAADNGRNDGEKFLSMLQKVNTPAELSVHYLPQNDWPENVDQYDAYLLGGSPCSANEIYAWTAQLTELIDAIIQRKKKLVGVCFGHQFIAKNLGGTVVRNDHGWLIGMHPLTIIEHQAWMSPQQAETPLYYFNQDVIQRLPAGARHIGTAENCHYASWCLDDQIFCVQAHPEQGIDSMLNFIKSTRDEIDSDILDTAEISMEREKPAADRWAEWIRNFLSDSDYRQ